MGERRQFLGKYAGVVFDNEDPKKLGRIKALVEEVGFIEDPTDWAYPCVSPLGGKADLGCLVVPDIGMNVWVEFESGDPNRPIWSGVYWSEPGGVSEAPDLAKGIADSSVQSITDSVGSVPDPFDASYPKNKVLKTTSGHIIEADDTPGHERLKIYHKAGTFLDIGPNGKLRKKVVSSEHTQTIGNLLQKVSGKYRILVDLDIEVVSASGASIVLDTNGNIIITNAAGKVKLGKGTLRQLIDDRAVAIFDGHVHDVPNVDPGSATRTSNTPSSSLAPAKTVDTIAS